MSSRHELSASIALQAARLNIGEMVALLRKFNNCTKIPKKYQEKLATQGLAGTDGNLTARGKAVGASSIAECKKPFRETRPATAFTLAERADMLAQLEELWQQLTEQGESCIPEMSFGVLGADYRIPPDFGAVLFAMRALGRKHPEGI